MDNVIVLDNKICKIEPTKITSNNCVIIETNSGLYREEEDGNILDGRIKKGDTLEDFIKYCQDNLFKIIGSKDNDYIYVSLESENDNFINRKEIFKDFINNKKYKSTLRMGLSGMFSNSRMYTEFKVQAKNDETYFDLFNSKEFISLIKEIQNEKCYDSMYLNIDGEFEFMINYDLSNKFISVSKIIEDFQYDAFIDDDELKEEHWTDFTIELRSNDKKYKTKKVLRYFKSGKKVEGVL